MIPQNSHVEALRRAEAQGRFQMFVRSVPQTVRMKRVSENGRSATLVEHRDSGTTRDLDRIVLFFESGS